jgi:hypothetical protein
MSGVVMSMKPWLCLAVVAACGDNLVDFKYGDQDPYFHWEGQTNVGAYRLDDLSPDALAHVLHRIDALDDEVLVLYGHASAQGGVPVATIDAVLARARDAGVDIVTFADLARGGPKRPGIAVTFDDMDIDTWFGFRETFARYDAHATFFVTRYHEWTDEGRQKLHVLFDEGHGVEAHGVHHVNVCVYTEAFGLDAYVTDEVVPSIEILRADGFHPVAFAFPGGTMGNAIVDALEPYVAITRGITQVP